MLTELKANPKVVGMKQIRKALHEGSAAKVFIADNADPHLTEPLAQQCEQLQVPVCSVATMAELGAACGIDVGAAAAAIVH